MPLKKNPIIKSYDRDKAVDYAHRWAMSRNPAYYDYDGIGGDCTNFASQVIYSGSGVMNHTAALGWYYNRGNNHSASWTGVEFLHEFLIRNNGIGPFAREVDMSDILPGDIIQLSFIPGRFGHSPVVVSVGNPVSTDNILVAAHTYDADYRPLDTYGWVDIRFLHIEGVRY